MSQGVRDIRFVSHLTRLLKFSDFERQISTDTRKPCNAAWWRAIFSTEQRRSWLPSCIRRSRFRLLSKIDFERQLECDSRASNSEACPPINRGKAEWFSPSYLRLCNWQHTFEDILHYYEGWSSSSLQIVVVVLFNGSDHKEQAGLPLLNDWFYGRQEYTT